MHQSFVFRHHAEIGQLLLKLMVLLFRKCHFSAVGAHSRAAHRLVSRECLIESVVLLLLDVAKGAHQWKRLLQYIVRAWLYLIRLHYRQLLQRKLYQIQRLSWPLCFHLHAPLSVELFLLLVKWLIANWLNFLLLSRGRGSYHYFFDRVNAEIALRVLCLCLIRFCLWAQLWSFILFTLRFFKPNGFSLMCI